MVNTFFVVANDPVASAACLDRQRLGKQRVEAYQVLNNLDDLRFLAGYLGLEGFPIDIDQPKHVRESWVRSVMTETRKLKAKYIHVDDSKTAGDKRIKPNITLYNVKPASIDNGYLIGMGFKSHPCVTMWLGFETGLCYYINAHINEWVSRGYKNTMTTYSEAQPIFPSWCNDEAVLDAFRANLMTKEIERFEPLHYMCQESFVTSYTDGDAELTENIYQTFDDHPQLVDEWHLKTPLAVDIQQYFLDSCRSQVKPYLWV